MNEPAKDEFIEWLDHTLDQALDQIWQANDQFIEWLDPIVEQIEQAIGEPEVYAVDILRTVVAASRATQLALTQALPFPMQVRAVTVLRPDDWWIGESTSVPVGERLTFLQGAWGWAVREYVISCLVTRIGERSAATADETSAWASGWEQTCVLIFALAPEATLDTNRFVQRWCNSC